MLTISAIIKEWLRSNAWVGLFLMFLNCGKTVKTELFYRIILFSLDNVALKAEY